MAVIAAGMITLSFERDILANYRYYKLQSSTATPPTKPTSITTLPPSGWTDTEPTYTEGSTNTLYTVDLTTYSDGGFYYTPVMKSSSYEAAKSAYNKAVTAQNTADTVQENLDNLSIGGRNLILSTLDPDISDWLHTPRLIGQESHTVTRSTTTPAVHGLRTTNDTGVTGYPFVRFGPTSGDHVGLNGLTAGETYTFSSDLKWKTLSNYTSSTVRKMQISVYTANNGGTAFSLLNAESVMDVIPGVEQSARGINTFTIPADATAIYIIVRDSHAGTLSLEGDFLELANIKLEKGNKATDWSPAPEDYETSIADSRTWYAECDTAGDVTTKVATITPATDLFNLTPGVVVTVKFTYENSGAVANLKMNVNGTGAKSIKYINNGTLGNLQGVAYIKAGVSYQFYYDGTYWIYQSNYNTTTNYYDRIRFQVAITAGVAIVSGNIIVADANGKYSHLKRGAAFDITYPILYAASAIAVNKTGTNNYLAFYFAIATTQELTLTANKTVYIKGTLNGTMFTPVSATPLTQTVPASIDGYQYIRLGFAYSSTNIYMDTDHSVYEFNNGGFKTISQIATEARERVQAMFNSLNGVDQFNTLTQNGALNGIFYSDSGDAYINADFIKTGSLAADKIAVSDLQAFSATIGGFDINSSSIHTHGVEITNNADNSVGLSSSLFTRTLGGVSRSDLKLAIGSNFGVGKDGTIYATNGVFTGTISGSTIIFNAESEGVDYSVTASANTWTNTYFGNVTGTLFTGDGAFGIKARLLDIETDKNGALIKSIARPPHTASFAGNIGLFSQSLDSNDNLLSMTTASLMAAGILILSVESTVDDKESKIQMGYEYTDIVSSSISLNGLVYNKNGGYIGYAKGIGSSESLSSYWTQGQYSVSGATGRPNKSNAYGILLSFMGNANEDSYTDDYAHSWGLQLYSDNDQLYYRTKTKTGASSWRSTFVTRKDFEVTLASLTWTASGSGMYYSGNLLTAAESAYWDHIDSVSLTAGWQSIRKTDFIIPYINGANVALMSNVNSFAAAANATYPSKVTVRVTGRRGVSNA